MMEFLRRFFSSDGFMPHGHCYLWEPGVLWLHILSDALITLAYFSIPFTLVYFVRKRKDLEFHWMFVCFAVFIIACGTTHLMEIIVIWHPVYWLSGSIKALTALASVPTAILLVKLVPQALQIPSPSALGRANAELQLEIAERKRADAELARVNAELEQRVADRTALLEKTNQALLEEIAERRRAEESLSENQRLLQAMSDNSTAVIYVKDLDGRYLLVNRQFREIFHFEQSDVLGKSDYDLFPKRDADAFRDLDRRVAAEGRALTAEESAPQDDGPHTYLSVKCPLRDESGRTYAVFGISTDITSRKREEETRGRLAAIVESSNDAVLSTNLEDVITSWNTGAETIFGYSAAEAIGQPARFFIPSDRANQEAAMLERIARGESAERMETVRRHKNGHLVDVSMTVSPIKDASGKVIGIAKIGRDITERKRVEEKIALLASFPEKNPNPVIEYDLASRKLSYANPASRQLFPDLQRSGENHPWLAGLDDIAKRLMEAPGEAVRREVVVDSGCFSETINYIPENHRLRMYGSDITERKRAEEALKESQALYHSLVEQMPAGVFRKDAQGRYVFVNSWFCQISGAIPSDFLGRTAWEVSAAMAQRGAMLDREKMNELAAQADDHHARIMRLGARIELDEERVFVDGRKQYLHVVKAPVFGVDAKISGSQGILIDITERKSAEDRLKDSIKEISDLKTALDAHAIVAVTNPQGKITHANDKFCAISKYTRDELLGQDHRIINSGFHSKEFFQNLWETIARGNVWKGEIRNRAKDGTVYWVDTTIVPFLDAGGKPYQYVAVRADITERKLAEEEVRKLNLELSRRVEDRTVELKNANEELEAFCYSVSHDLRAPLRHIDGFVTLLQKDSRDSLSDRARHYMAQIADSARQMGRLIDDLLVFSRMSRAGVVRTKVALDQLFDETIRKLEPDIQGRNIVWKRTELPTVNADASMLRQVAVNLLSNAIKYSRPRDPAVIEIGALKSERDEVVIFVRDNGVGFEMAYADKLFGVFQRLHAHEDFEGTGIGLANVRRIIARHGGRTWAEAAPDAGATFYFSLPNRNATDS